MKVTKNVLKTVVKECLIEILSEGFSLSQTKSQSNINDTINEAKRAPRRKTSDLIKFENRVKETSQSLTSDPVLSSIFEDTAKTTLQEQLNTPSSVSAGDRAAYAAATNDPADLFGESADKWASLAFGNSKK